MKRKIKLLYLLVTLFIIYIYCYSYSDNISDASFSQFPISTNCTFNNIQESSYIEKDSSSIDNKSSMLMDWIKILCSGALGAFISSYLTINLHKIIQEDKSKTKIESIIDRL